MGIPVGTTPELTGKNAERFMLLKAHRFDKNRLRELIAEKSLIIREEGSFKLASGGESKFFFDMKNVSLDPEGANLIAEGIMEILKDEEVDYIGGLESGAIPIVAAVCQKSWLMGRPIPGVFCQKGNKRQGDKKAN